MGLQTDAPRREAGEAAGHSDFCFHPSAMRLADIVAAGKASSLFLAFLAMSVSALALVSDGAAQRRGARDVNAGANAVDLLIVGGVVVTMNSNRRVFENGFVAVKGERVFDVGDAADLKARGFKAGHVIDARGKVVLPGLINAHTHIPMTLFRGVADDLDLQDWLSKYIFPAEAKNVTRDFVVAGARLGLAEMIRGGTTTYADMY